MELAIGGAPAPDEEAAAAAAAAADDGSADRTDGSSPTGDGGSALKLPQGKLRLPEDTNGHYVVLVAVKPPRGQRADYQEVACVKAHDPDHAKKVVLGEAGRTKTPVEARDELARTLLAMAAEEKRGILLRAVPAMHWPGEIEPTTFVRPEPVLKIG